MRRRQKLKPGVRRYLEQFRKAGIPMAVATSSGRENVEACISKTFGAGSISGYFDLFGSGTGEKSSEDLSGGSRKIGTRPEETWVFEDTCHALLTAKRAGFRTVAVYDRASRKDLDTLKSEADIFLTEYGDVELFLQQASAR